MRVLLLAACLFMYGCEQPHYHKHYRAYELSDVGFHGPLFSSVKVCRGWLKDYHTIKNNYCIAVN